MMNVLTAPTTSERVGKALTTIGGDGGGGTGPWARRVGATVPAILRRIVLGAALFLPTAVPALAEDADAPAPLRVYAAGSLTGAMGALLAAFGTPPGTAARPTFGPSGLLRERLERGEPADLFASADMGQPQHLADAGRGTPVVLFTRNRMRALGRETLGLTTANLLGRLLDPTGYRADMLFQLAALQCAQPALYNTLLEHYAVTRPADVIGTSYDYQIIYESSAYAAYRANPSAYRYVRLPSAVNLGDISQNRRYSQAFTVVPGFGLPGGASKVTIPATHAVRGVTILNTAPHYAAAVQFLQLLFSAQGVVLQAASGPTPISPSVVSHADYGQLPAELQSVVSRQ